LILLIWFALLLIGVTQGGALLAERRWWDFAVFATLWLGAGVYATLVVGGERVDQEIPNHTEIVIAILSHIYRWLGLG